MNNIQDTVENNGNSSENVDS